MIQILNLIKYNFYIKIKFYENDLMKCSKYILYPIKYSDSTELKEIGESLYILFSKILELIMKNCNDNNCPPILIFFLYLILHYNDSNSYRSSITFHTLNMYRERQNDEDSMYLYYILDYLLNIKKEHLYIILNY